MDAPAPIRDRSEHAADMSPVESQRQLSIEAEHNVLDRLEKARLIAPPGPVDKVLETVVNNLRATNQLDNLPPIQCRVMLDFIVRVVQPCLYDCPQPGAYRCLAR